MLAKQVIRTIRNLKTMSVSALCITCCLLLAGCGGGGGGGTTATAALDGTVAAALVNTLLGGSVDSEQPAPIVGNSVTTCGDITSSGTYVLQNDVSSDGTCFTIKAPNVVLNLNGHTVTYDNLAPVSVPNGDFESVLSGSWDTTYAPNAARAAGTYIQPVSLYSGNYALRFALPFTGPQYVRSQQVTLAANTTYSISAMFRNSGNNELAINTYSGGVRDSLTMKIELEGTASSATQTGVTWRGFQYTNFTYTTGASPENHVIRITVDNVNAAATGYAYVDDIKILKTPSYGVYIGQSYAASNYARITNGTITQGQGGGFASHAIKIDELGGTGWSVDNLTLTTNGVNSKAFFSYYMTDSTFNNNVINHNVTTIKSRDNYDGAAVHVEYHSGAGTVHSNTFNSGIQSGIMIASPSSGQHAIYSNNITLQSKYTNDFAIVAEGSDSYSNVINCGSGANACRGIWAGGTGTIVRNNTITVQQLARNQEYNGCEINGAYGIQNEKSTNTSVYGNTVAAIANECDAHAYRANPKEDSFVSSGISVHDNYFIASKVGSSVHASSILLSDLDTGIISFTNNSMTTNDLWVKGAYGVDFSTLGCLWNISGTLSTPFHPFYVNTYGGGYVALTATDNSYGAGAETYFTSGAFYDQLGNLAAGSSIIIAP